MIHDVELFTQFTVVAAVVSLLGAVLTVVLIQRWRQRRHGK